MNCLISGTMQVTARHPLMADMQHVSQQVAPEARPPRNDNLHCANIATFVPPNKHKVRHLSVFFFKYRNLNHTQENP